jgi:hypothetical protein
MSVRVLFVIPRTPFCKRFEKEGRLRESLLMSGWGAVATNIVPPRMTSGDMREGYFKLFDELYHPDAFFARMEAVCFATGWSPDLGRTRDLMLRWRHRQQLRRVLLRRSNPRAVRIYAMACAARFHNNGLIARLKAAQPVASQAGGRGVGLGAGGVRSGRPRSRRLVWLPRVGRRRECRGNDRLPEKVGRHVVVLGHAFATVPDYIIA